jgi:hypothetical protein
MNLLILRFAAELFNRAVLFVVKDGKRSGSRVRRRGAVSPERQASGASPSPDQPVPEPRCTAARRFRSRSPGALNRTLLDQLGGSTPLDAVAMPLISGGRVRVILYGDNLPEARGVGSTRALELFLEQAGEMLEKALLEKKLHEPGAAAAPAGRSERRGGGAGR